MRQSLFFVGVTLGLLLVAGSVQALSQGPGGRLYNAGPTTDSASYPPVYSTTLSLYSVVLDANWDVVGTEESHGTINCGWRGEGWLGNIMQVTSPELETYGGTGYGQIVMGSYYNNDPASAMGTETMDVLRVTPSSGSLAVTVLGNGRAGNSGWYSDSANYPSTDQGYYAIPDPTGGFTGHAEGGYYITNEHAYKYTTNVVHDANADGDCTDNDADYGDWGHVNKSGIDDFELLGNRMYMRNNIYLQSGIHYYQNNGGVGPQITQHSFSQDCATILIGPNQTGLSFVGGTGLAVGKVEGHDTAWALVNYGDGQGGPVSVAMFKDVNNNGLIDDNSEITVILTGSEVNLGLYGAWIDYASPTAPNASWADLELVTNDAGKMFLLALNNAAHWAYGDALVVFELDDNGDFTGGNANAKIIYTTNYGADAGLYHHPGVYGRNSMEFDKVAGEVIPEPTTLLLLGTGALGAIGYLRRKRMG